MFNPEVKRVEAQYVAYLMMTGPYDQMPQAMGRLYGWVSRQGMEPVGMPGAVYLTDPATVPEAEAEWEIWAPVDGDVTMRDPDESGMGVKRLPDRYVASAVHKGPYEQVGQTYDQLWAWIQDNDFTPTGPPEEYYLNDPATVSGPEEYLTEVHFPVLEP